MGQPPGPGRGPLRQAFGGERAHGGDAEPDRRIGGRQGSLQVGRVERRQPETHALGPIALRVDPEDDAETGVGLAEAANAGKGGRSGERDGGQQAAPWEDDRDAVRRPRQLRGKVLDRGADVEQVARAGPEGAPRRLAQCGGVRVDADEQTLRRFPGHDARKPSVAGAEVDRHPAPEGGQVVPDLLIGAFETLAANEVHGSSIARGGRGEEDGAGEESEASFSSGAHAASRGTSRAARC